MSINRTFLVGSICTVSACGGVGYLVFERLKNEQDSSQNLNPETTGSPAQGPEEDKTFTGKLFVYIKNEQKDSNNKNTTKDIYQLILLNQDESKTKIKEWIVAVKASHEDEEEKDVKRYSKFEVTKPVNKEKADSLLEKLNSSIASSSEELELKQKFKNLFDKHENKKEFEDVFGEDLYKKILNSIDLLPTSSSYLIF